MNFNVKSYYNMMFFFFSNFFYVIYTFYNHFVYGNNNSNNKIIIQHYHDKYYTLFDKLDCNELSEEYLKNLSRCILFEYTPKGSVILYYDYDKQSFIFYCDNKDISYLFLETVVRKYAITYNCKKLVVDIKQELNNAKESNANSSIQNNNSITTSDTNSNTNNVFASLKQYNRKGSGGNKVTDKKYILRKNANRYSYRGKINEFSFIQTQKYMVEKPNDIIDYKTFKKFMMKKN